MSQEPKSQTGTKLFTVFGASGLLGHSLIDPALKAGFAVRAVTRDKNEDSAKELSGKGVEVVECNVLTAKEAELKEVMKDSYAAFLVTDYWDENAVGKEEDIGKKLVDAAKAAGVKHLLWSGLDNVKKVSKGKWEVPMFSQKAVISDYINELQSKPQRAFDYTTLIAPSFYFQNFQLSSVAKKEGNEWVFNLPETRWLTACDADEMGHAVVAALKDPAASMASASPIGVNTLSPTSTWRPSSA
jgi:uncharacterized protein YbjT (DUF2867 family)